jgi:hypothetical protein
MWQHAMMHTKTFPDLGYRDVLGVLGEELCLEGISNAADDNASPASVEQITTLFCGVL